MECLHQLLKDLAWSVTHTDIKDEHCTGRITGKTKQMFKMCCFRRCYGTNDYDKW